MIIVQLDMDNSTPIMRNIYYEIGNEGLRVFVKQIEEFVKDALRDSNNTISNELKKKLKKITNSIPFTFPFNIISIKPNFEQINRAMADGYRLTFKNTESAYRFVKIFCKSIEQRNNNNPNQRPWLFRIGAAKDDNVDYNKKSYNSLVAIGFVNVNELETGAYPGWFFVDDLTYQDFFDFSNDIKNKLSKKSYKTKHDEVKQAWACQMMLSGDYTRLRKLLAAKKWKEADEETLTVMLQATGRAKEGWLDRESIENFSSTKDFHRIDQLWVEHSDGHFGFSVQNRIWESVNKDYKKFGDCVGWRKVMFWNKEWLHYNELTFSTNAPKGHLPVFLVGGREADKGLYRRYGYRSSVRLRQRFGDLNRPQQLGRGGKVGTVVLKVGVSISLVGGGMVIGSLLSQSDL